MLLIGLEDAVLDGLDRGLNGHERRAQLMGDIAYELTLEVAVALDGVGHLVETLPELPELIVTGKPGARGEIALLDGRGGVGNALDGTRDADSEVDAEDDAQRPAPRERAMAPAVKTAKNSSSSPGSPA